jgi:hypothetical protein
MWWGYTRLIEQDEAGTLAALKDRHKRVLTPLVSEHEGRIVKVMGDGVLVEFASAVNAVACAVELQKCMAIANDCVAEHRRIVLRVGINLGDVVVEGGPLWRRGHHRRAAPGDGGARGTYVSGGCDQVGKAALAFEDLGPPGEEYRQAGPGAACEVDRSDRSSGGAPSHPNHPSLYCLSPT